MEHATKTGLHDGRRLEPLGRPKLGPLLEVGQVELHAVNRL